MDNWTKKVTETGLALMMEEAKRERLNIICRGNTIDREALAFLIDECAYAVGQLLEEHKDILGPEESEKIIENLGNISGSKAVAGSDPDELMEWMMELRV